MTAENEVHGPGLIGYILLEPEELADPPRFKRAIKWQDCKDNTYWNCGECNKTLPYHTPDCPVHVAYLEAEKAKAAYVRPDWMCEGCDRPKEGPHRFSCYARGARASQVVLPVTQNTNGTFSVDPPYSTNKP